MKFKKSERVAPASPVLTVPQAAEYLGFGVTTIYKLMAAGRLASFKIGKSRRIPRDSCDQLIVESLAEAGA